MRNRGADCIIYSVHDGYNNYGEELSNYVDVVFEGHTHSSYVRQDSYGVYHLQGGGDNKAITHAELTVNFARNKTKRVAAEKISTSVYSGLAGDSVVDLVSGRYTKEVETACKPLGINDALRESDEISSLVAKLYYEAGVKKWGGQYEIALGGGSLNLRAPYIIYPGQVVYGDVYDVLTFDNQLELCKVKGSVLKSRFINNSSYYIYTTLSVSDVVDTQDYYIVLDTWSSRYAPNKTTVIARYDETTFARDLLADYIKNGGWTTPTVYKTIAEIHALSGTLINNQTTQESFCVKGKIVEILNKTYGNCIIEDENGNKLFVYGLYDVEGNRYDAMSNVPTEGDSVTLRSKVKKYSNVCGEVELFNAIMLSVE